MKKTVVQANLCFDIYIVVKNVNNKINLSVKLFLIQWKIVIIYLTYNITKMFHFISWQWFLSKNLRVTSQYWAYATVNKKKHYFTKIYRMATFRGLYYYTWLKKFVSTPFLIPHKYMCHFYNINFNNGLQPLSDLISPLVHLQLCFGKLLYLQLVLLLSIQLVTCLLFSIFRIFGQL